MPTPFDIFGVVESAGQKLVAALFFPAGLATAAGTTIDGGTLNAPVTIDEASEIIYMGLESSGSGVYSGESDIGGTALPDSTNRPYTVEVRVVDAGTDMTDYTELMTAFSASSDVAYTRDAVPLNGGYLVDGAWHTSAQAIAEAVGEETGIDADMFEAIYNATGRITQGNIIVTAGTRNGVLTIMQGHTYADGVALQVTQPDGTWPDLANYPTNGISLTLTLVPPYTNHAVYVANTNVGRVTITGATVTGTFAATNQAVAFRPGTVTATLVPTTQGYPKQPYDAQVWAVSGTNSKLLFDGMAPVTKDIRS
jgi:hypothetical protein